MAKTRNLVELRPKIHRQLRAIQLGRRRAGMTPAPITFMVNRVLEQQMADIANAFLPSDLSKTESKTI